MTPEEVKQSIKEYAESFRYNVEERGWKDEIVTHTEYGYGLAKEEIQEKNKEIEQLSYSNGNLDQTIMGLEGLVGALQAEIARLTAQNEKKNELLKEVLGWCNGTKPNRANDIRAKIESILNDK